MTIEAFAVASASEHPLIDIDLTVFIQLVLFALTALLASRLLFRPYLKLRDERERGIEGAKEEATRMSAQADGQLADYRSKLASAKARAEEERRALRAEASTHEREVLEATRQEALRAQEQAQDRIRSQTETARATLRPRAEEIAQAVAAKLLGRELV